MRRAALLLLALAACHPHAPAPPAPPAPPPLVFEADAVDRWVAAQLKDRGEVGAALVVVRDGKVVLAKGYGTRAAGQNLPVDADTPFAIGSVSKELTCAAAMTLVDQGKLDMHAKVATYYPSLTSAADITLDQLGAHLSGYPDYYPLDYVDDRMARPIAPDDLLARYATGKLDFTPGTRWSYSNTGFVLLARIVEKAAGVPLGQLLTERVFGPLGMTHTTLGPPKDGAAAGHDTFYLGAPVAIPIEAKGWLFGAGEVFSTANDLARWDLGLVDGKILSSAARTYMMTPHPLANGRSSQYGCGLFIDQRRGETVISHDGAVAGFLAYNAFVPRKRAAVVLLVNDDAIDVQDVFDTVVDLIVAHPEDIPTIPGPSPGDAALALIEGMQAGHVDRATLGDDFNAYLDDAHLAAIAPRLRALGTPTVTVTRRAERGGMEVAVLSIAFPAKTVTGYLYRTPDGKIHELLLMP